MYTVIAFSGARIVRTQQTTIASYARFLQYQDFRLGYSSYLRYD